MLYNVFMPDKPKRQDVIDSMDVLKRWYHQAKNRNKKNAMEEIVQLYNILEYFKENTDFRIGK